MKGFVIILTLAMFASTEHASSYVFYHDDSYGYHGGKSYGMEESHHEYDNHPVYMYGYEVMDPQFDKRQSYWELSDGDDVNEEYTLNEDDDREREMTYHEDKISDFQDNMERIGHAYNPEVYNLEYDYHY